MSDIITLPDGSQRGTGLIASPLLNASVFRDYVDVGPMLSKDDIIAAAKTGKYRGRDRFDESFTDDQKNHGSCNGFAGAWALTRARIRRGLPRVDLSGAYLYSLINGNRDQGSTLDAGMAALTLRGCCTRQRVGWDQVFRSDYNTSEADAEAANYKAFECYRVTTEEELFSGLINGFDAVVAVHANNSFNKLDSRGVAGVGNGPGNHAVLNDGVWWDGELIGDGNNSWGRSWGDKGRMGMTWRNHFQYTTRYHPFYLIRSTLDPKQEDNPPPDAADVPG